MTQEEDTKRFNKKMFGLFMLGFLITLAVGLAFVGGSMASCSNAGGFSMDGWKCVKPETVAVCQDIVGGKQYRLPEEYNPENKL